MTTQREEDSVAALLIFLSYCGYIMFCCVPLVVRNVSMRGVTVLSCVYIKKRSLPSTT
jgi:hypothetical protein